MAQILLRDPYDAVSGAVNRGGVDGAVLYRLGTGQSQRNIRRDYVVPTNPDSTLQVAWRDNLRLIAQAYQSVTDAELTGWEELAAQLQSDSVFGVNFAYTAQAAYQSVNAYRLANGQAITDTAPIKGTSALPTTAYTIQKRTGPDGLVVSFDVNNETLGGFYFFTFSSVLPGLRRQARRNDCRTRSAAFSGSINAINTGSSSQSFTIAAPYVASFPAGTNRLGFYVVILDDNYVPLIRGLQGSTDVASV